MLKRQLFDNSNSERRATKVYKRLPMNENDNEEQNLVKYESKINGYVFFPPTALSLLPPKELNRPSNLNKGIRSLTHLVCISTTASQRITNFASVFSGRGVLKPKKIHISCLKEGLKAHLASTASTDSDTTNHRRLIREHLEFHPPSNHRQGLGAQAYSN